jgi:malonyl-ACP decarboxylase
MSTARVIVTGMGVYSALATSIGGYTGALKAGRRAVHRLPLSHLQRSVPAAILTANPEFEGPNIRRVLRGTPRSTQAGCAAALEALATAGWTSPDCAVVVGGSNLHMRFIAETHEQFVQSPEYVNPRYAVTYLDSSLAGALSEIAGLRGPGFNVGGGMASGNLAVYQGWCLIRAGLVGACLCLGAMTEFSELELVAFGNLGALAPFRDDVSPTEICRPFDQAASGFVYGEGAGAVLLENLEQAQSRGATPLAEIAGAAVLMQGHSGAEPSAAGEAEAMRRSLDAAKISPAELDYLSAHGTGTPAGDAVECEAIHLALQDHAARPAVNATKALTGHTISAAGVLELIASILQIRGRFLHPNPNLTSPIDSRLRFAPATETPLEIRTALSNSFSIGGLNTSVAIKKI